MNFENILYDDIVFLDVEMTQRAEVFSHFANVLYQKQLIYNKEQLINELDDKEKQISTSIGYQIALPHIQSTCIRDPLIGFMRGKEGIIWNPTDHSKVKLIFLIAVPKKFEGQHIHILANLSRKLMNGRIRAQLLKMEKNKEIFDVLA